MRSNYVPSSTYNSIIEPLDRVEIRPRKDVGSTYRHFKLWDGAMNMHYPK